SYAVWILFWRVQSAPASVGSQTSSGASKRSGGRGEKGKLALSEMPFFLALLPSPVLLFFFSRPPWLGCVFACVCVWVCVCVCVQDNSLGTS
ncbi:hypothetical protein DFJ73DRAFT_875735, partial [Zopfochytrium polystomum]